MKIDVAALLKQPYGSTEGYDIGEERVTERSEHAALAELGVRAVSGSARLTHTNLGVYVEADVEAEMNLECARCLDLFWRPIPVRAQEQYYTRFDVVSGAPRPDAPRDAYTIGHDFLIDVSKLLREHILLELPPKPLCRESCAGICPICGEDQNERPHRHAPEADERWSALGELANLRNREE